MNSDYVKKLKNICAVVPCYVQNMNKQTKVYYVTGEISYSSYSINRIINDYCAINMVSFKYSKKISGIIVNRKNNIPFIIKNAIMLPVKTVKPYYKGDKCFGYINILYIKNFIFKEKKIFLTEGNIINFIEKQETIKKRLAECTLLKYKVDEIMS